MKRLDCNTKGLKRKRIGLFKAARAEAYNLIDELKVEADAEERQKLINLIKVFVSISDNGVKPCK